MKTRFIAALLMAASLVSLTPAFSSDKVMKPAEVSKAVQVNPFDIPATVNGVATTLSITDFVLRNGQIVALGTIQGVPGLIALPITIPSATCEILTLDVGAIHLDLLGLVVDVAPINIDIVAQAAPGNLLGNLLCAITNLLNNPSSQLNGVVGLLDRVLRIFG